MHFSSEKKNISFSFLKRYIFSPCSGFTYQHKTVWTCLTHGERANEWHISKKNHCNVFRVNKPLLNILSKLILGGKKMHTWVLAWVLFVCCSAIVCHPWMVIFMDGSPEQWVGEKKITIWGYFSEPSFDIFHMHLVRKKNKILIHLVRDPPGMWKEARVRKAQGEKFYASSKHIQAAAWNWTPDFGMVMQIC